MQISEKFREVMERLAIPKAGFTQSRFNNGGSVKSEGNKSRKKVKK